MPTESRRKKRSRKEISPPPGLPQGAPYHHSGPSTGHILPQPPPVLAQPPVISSPQSGLPQGFLSHSQSRSSTSHMPPPPSPVLAQPPATSSPRAGLPQGAPSQSRSSTSHIPPPSPQSVASARTANASTLAKGQAAAWTAAESRNKFMLWKARTVPELDELWREIKYPRCLEDENFIKQITGRHEKMATLHYLEPIRYQEWISSLHVNEWEVNQEDPYELQYWGYMLFASWNSNASAISLSGKEAAVRKGVDNMLELAFKQRLNAKHIIQVEKSLPLPALPKNAIADSITTMDLPLDWSDFLGLLDHHYVFALDAETQVITFAFEAKCGNATAAARQLAFDLCSAQNQQRALGLDGQLFGATLVGDNLTIYGSHWNDNILMIYPTKHRFSLATFPGFLKVYIFLCKIADLMAKKVDQAIEQWSKGDNTKLIQRAHEASQNPWRLPQHSDGMMLEDWESSEDEDELMAIDGMGYGYKGNLLTKANLQALSLDTGTKGIQDWSQSLVNSIEIV